MAYFVKNTEQGEKATDCKKRQRMLVGGLASLLVFLVVSCFFSAHALSSVFFNNQEEEEVEILLMESLGTLEEMTNIILVVDCSSSMQSSDSYWNLPESLSLLVDMFPNDDNVRLSMILYGTTAEVVIQDIPLTTTGKETIKESIQTAIVQYGYNRGQTDTGAALMAASEILSDRANQNNKVVLFTDGAIKATSNGRTTAQSQEEVTAFIAFAQENNVTVDVFGLFNVNASQSDIDQSAEELELLCVQSSGQYQRIENMDDLSGRLQELMAEFLDVRSLELSEGIAQTVQEKAAYQYDFSIETNLQDDITFVLPASEGLVDGVILTASDGTQYEVANGTKTITDLPVFTGATLSSYVKYTGSPGYTVVHLSRASAPEWIDDWTLSVVTSSKTAPVVNAFYAYDVSLNFEINESQVSVMESVTLKVYLTTSDGLRISDTEFIDGLQAEITVINVTNKTAQSISIDAVDELDDADEASEALDTETVEIQIETVQLTRAGDQFVYEFQAQYASSYYFEVEIGNETFTRTATTLTFDVEDNLFSICNISPSKINKREEFVISGYMIQSDSGQKVEGVDYYNSCGASAIIVRTDVTPNTTKEVYLVAMEDGSGLYGTTSLDAAGTYSVAIITDSGYESLTQEEQEARLDSEESVQTFEIVDRPLSVSLLSTAKWNFLAFVGIEKTIDISTLFVDADNDAFSISVIGNDNIALDGNDVLYWVPQNGNDITITLAAVSYASDEQVTTTIEVIVLTVWDVTGIVLILLASGWLLAFLLARTTALKGVAKIELVLNDAPRGQARKVDGQVAPRMTMGEYFVSMQDASETSEDERLQKTKLSMWKMLMPRKYAVSDLVTRYVEVYGDAGYDDDPAHQALKKYLGSTEFKKGLGYICGNIGAKKFKVAGVKNKQKMVNAENDVVIYAAVANDFKNEFTNKLQLENAPDSVGTNETDQKYTPVTCLSVRIEYYDIRK